MEKICFLLFVFRLSRSASRIICLEEGEGLDDLLCAIHYDLNKGMDLKTLFTSMKGLFSISIELVGEVKRELNRSLIAFQIRRAPPETSSDRANRRSANIEFSAVAQQTELRRSM